MIAPITFSGVGDVHTGRCSISIIDPAPIAGDVIEPLNCMLGWHVCVYESGEAFLDAYPVAPGLPSCIISEVTLPGMSGLGLQARLKMRGVGIPVIFACANPTVAMVVQAMKNGAIDFLEKPLHRQLLMERIQNALDMDAEANWQRSKRAKVVSQFEALSPRERQIMQYLVEGKNTKAIASSLQIGPKTVAKHRTRVLAKLQVESVIELARCYPSTIKADPGLAPDRPVRRQRRASARPR